MSTIAFFDIETDRNGKRILNIGACLDDGRQFHDASFLPLAGKRNRAHLASFFPTRLLEKGVDFCYIQELLGHKSAKTTGKLLLNVVSSGSVRPCGLLWQHTELQTDYK